MNPRFQGHFHVKVIEYTRKMQWKLDFTVNFTENIHSPEEKVTKGYREHHRECCQIILPDFLTVKDRWSPN